MACGLSDSQITDICFDCIHKVMTGNVGIDENSPWSVTGLNSQARAIVYAAIVGEIKGKGCNVRGISSSDFTGESKIGGSIEVIKTGIKNFDEAAQTEGVPDTDSASTLAESSRLKGLSGRVSDEYLRGYQDGIQDGVESLIRRLEMERRGGLE